MNRTDQHIDKINTSFDKIDIKEESNLNKEIPTKKARISRYNHAKISHWMLSGFV